ASFSPSRTGLVMSLLPLVSLFCGPLSGWIADRRGAVPVAGAAALFMAAGALCFAFSGLSFSLPLTLSGLALFGLGLGFFFPANVSFVMGRAPSGSEGALSAVLNAAQSTSGAAGVAVFSGIYSARLSSFPQEGAAASLSAFAACGWAGMFCALAALAFTWASARRMRV
ncbi:MAG: MFS transporter, partial [Elusimicrobia bacterium]|nr:MFS transporter [Elusimicrobiota bacterium]